MTIKRTLGTIVLASALTLGVAGCKNKDDSAKEIPKVNYSIVQEEMRLPLAIMSGSAQSEWSGYEDALKNYNQLIGQGYEPLPSAIMAGSALTVWSGLDGTVKNYNLLREQGIDEVSAAFMAGSHQTRWNGLENTVENYNKMAEQLQGQ